MGPREKWESFLNHEWPYTRGIKKVLSTVTFFASVTYLGKNDYVSPSKYSPLTRTHFSSLFIHSENAFLKASLVILLTLEKGASQGVAGML